MELYKWKVLLKAIELGSLNKAAEELNYTQAGLSHIINSLEKEVGFQLLHRGYNGVSMTEDTKKLLPIIKKLIQDSDVLNAEIEDIKKSHKETICVAALTSIAIQWLPVIIRKYNEQNPNVTVNIRMVDLTANVGRLLRQEDVDIVLTSRLAGDEYNWISLKRDRMYAVLPPNDNTGNAQTFPLEKFDQLNFYVASQGYDIDMMHIMEAVNAKPNYIPIDMDDRAIINLIEQGMGVTILPELAIRGYSDKVKVLPVSPYSYREIGMAVRVSDNTPDYIRQFIDVVQTVVLQIEHCNCENIKS